MKRAFLFAIAAVIALSTLSVVNAQPANAVGASDWKAGNIIDDAVFADSGSMSVSQIQDFLNKRVGTGSNGVAGKCDTNGTRTSELGGGTRAQYGAANGNPAPFTCLKDYYEVPKTTPSPGIPANNYGNKPIPEGAKSAAQLIWDAARQHSISPKVLLIKLATESSGPLTSDDWPFLKQYTYAMGAHCPDSGPGGSANCDSNYAGFSMQISEAAALLRYYLNNMTQPWWSYKKPYQNNNILWNVTQRNCGGSNVYIESKATAALYTYTPYQPNQAALNNMYGTGDNCSAYGNRNFWRVFNDWFGPTLGNSNFLRTVDNTTLYLVSGDTKHPISDISMFGALYQLGGVGYVSQAYLDTKTTGSLLGRVIRSSDGTVYFYDAGIKLPFGSCAQVEAYGSSCGQSILLQDYQINSLAQGPSMTTVLGTTSGKLFYMDGTKHEVYDPASLSIVGMENASVNFLNETALSNLSYGAPIVRQDTFIKDRSDESLLYAYSGSTLRAVNRDAKQDTYLKTIPSRPLDSTSISKLTQGTAMGGYLKAADGTSYIVVDNGKIKVTTPAEWSASFVLTSDAILNQIPTTSTLAGPYFFKTKSSGTVYFVSAAQKRPILGWADLLALSPNPTILTLPDYYANTIADGPFALGPGSLVKTANDATVYVIDGLNKKIPLNSFSPSQELGFTSLRVVPDNALTSYTTTNYLLTSTITCGSNQGVAIGGIAYRLNIQNATYMAMSPLNCNLLTWKDAPGFLVAPNGTIYQAASSQKRPISGYVKYLELGGTDANTIRASNYILDMLPTGATL
ncbi:MAG: hemagglutinin-like protein [Candidatus Saccharibacteria bacterium]|nr:hemagglutinin-like protein [Candidatus Saccharibacteria bacterium]